MQNKDSCIITIGEVDIKTQKDLPPSHLEIPIRLTPISDCSLNLDHNLNNTKEQATDKPKTEKQSNNDIGYSLTNGQKILAATDKITSRLKEEKEVTITNKTEHEENVKWVISQLLSFGLSRAQMTCALRFLHESPRARTSKDWMLELTLREAGSRIRQVRMGPRISITRPEAVEPQSSQKKSQTKYTCTICYTKYKDEDEKAKPLNCDHDYCKKCYRQYLKNLIDSNRVSEIPCPDETCDQKFNDAQIEETLNDKELFKKYIRFKTRASLYKNPNVRWCVRPGCENHMIGSPGDKMIKCSCGAEVCFPCGSAYHEGKTCEQVLADGFKNYKNKKKIQFCKGCKARVEKSDGCNHMTCSICRYQWCWLCQRAYTSDHYSKLNPLGCPGQQFSNTTSCERNIVRCLLLIVWPFLLFYLAIRFPLDTYRSRLEIKSNCGFFFLRVLGVVLAPLWMFIVILKQIKNALN